MRRIVIPLFNACNEHKPMRVVEDEDGERFLELESEEDIDELFNAAIKRAEEKARARKPSYEA